MLIYVVLARVTVKDLSDGMEEIYELVGPGDEDFDGDILKILSTSPLALVLVRMVKKMATSKWSPPSGRIGRRRRRSGRRFA